MIILASHGKLAEGMKDTVEMIVGPQEKVFAYCAYDNGVDSVKEFVRERIQGVKGEKVYILTDVLGGSVNTEMSELLLEFPDVQLITGMNLPMILTLLTAGDDISLSHLIEEGRENIISMNELIKATQAEEDIL